MIINYYNHYCDQLCSFILYYIFELSALDETNSFRDYYYVFFEFSLKDYLEKFHIEHGMRHCTRWPVAPALRCIDTVVAYDRQGALVSCKQKLCSVAISGHSGTAVRHSVIVCPACCVIVRFLSAPVF